MGQSWRRLRRTLGWWGSLNLVLAVVVLLITAEYGFPTRAGNAVLPVIYALGLLFVTTQAWGRYRRSVQVPGFREVLPQLLTSTTEFALLLRPFGADGEVLLPDPTGRRHASWFTTPWRTVEQVVADAVRDVLAIDTYALVDAGFQLAPPGPVYVRASHDEWQLPIRAMIRRAHTVVVLLPPGQGLRPALEWEVAEIVAARRQSRVILVLPPPGRGVDGPDLRRQAATVLTAMFTGRPLMSVTPAQATATMDALPPDTLVVGVRRNGPDHEPVPWYLVPPPTPRSRSGIRFGTRRRSVAGGRTYRSALAEALGLQRDAWSGFGFARRYPWHPAAVEPDLSERKAGGTR